MGDTRPAKEGGLAQVDVPANEVGKFVQGADDGFH
jgi:hypothetical protein